MNFKNLFLILFCIGLIFSSSGTTTMQWPNSGYFMFSTMQTYSYDYAISNYNNPAMEFDISLEPWNAPAWCSNFIDMGAVSLDSLGDYPPSSGYPEDELGFENCAYVEINHAYWIKTKQNNYAKVKITGATYLGSDDYYGNINKITFDWVYYGSSTGQGSSGDGWASDDYFDSEGFCCASAFLILLCFLGFISKN